MRYYVNKKDVKDTVDKLNRRQCEKGVFWNIAVKEYKGKKYPADTMVVIEGQVFNMNNFEKAMKLADFWYQNDYETFKNQFDTIEESITAALDCITNNLERTVEMIRQEIDELEDEEYTAQAEEIIKIIQGDKNNPHFDNKAIAENIYDASLDMDYADYEEYRDEEIKCIKKALDDIEKNDNYVSLYNALGMIFEQGVTI